MVHRKLIRDIVFHLRYCYLRQEVDGTYILELHKDEKQGDAKATIVMDFCTEVAQVWLLRVNAYQSVAIYFEKNLLV